MGLTHLTISGSKRRERGSAIILAVSVLVLLTVMGTAFIVIARTERNSSRAMSDVLNLDRARDAVLGDVVRQIASSGADLQGRPLTMAVPWMPGVTYYVGDVVYVHPFDGHCTAPLDSVATPSASRFQTFVCTAQHVSGYGTTDGPPGRGTAWSTSGKAFYTTARRYDYPEVGGTFGISSTGNSSVASPDEPWLVSTGDVTHYCRLTDRRYSPAQGGFSAVFPVAPEVAVIDPTGAPDGAYQMLPMTSGAGLRYRYSFRVEDESARANLNVGNPDSAAGMDPTGNYLTSIELYAPSICMEPSWISRNIHGGMNQNVWGRAPGSTMDLAGWEKTVLRYESSRVAETDPSVAFFDLADELELRTYGVRGGGGMLRPSVNCPNATFMFHSLSAGSANRQYYTTQSFTRETLPLPLTHMSYTVGGAGVFGYPRKVCFNEPTPLSNAGASAVAAIASNLAAAMETCGYSSREARSLAINFIAYKIGFGNMHSPSGGYWLPNGPSFIDGEGIKLRTATGMVDFIGPHDLHSDENGAAYIGLSAQPFINEVVARVDPENGATPVDYAVELANPYPYDIDLAGASGDPNSAWTLEIRDSSQHVLASVSLARAAGGKIAANGFYVVTFGKGFTGEVFGPTHSDASLKIPQNGSVVLKRPVKLKDTSSTFDGATIVDEFAWGNSLYPSSPAIGRNTMNYSLQRDNSNLWMSAIGIFNSEAGPSNGNGLIAEEAPAGHTLGRVNTVQLTYANAEASTFYRLYDRMPAPADANNSILTFAEFNRIPRVTNIQLAGDRTRSLSGILASAKQLSAGKDVTRTESALRFDFRAYGDSARNRDPRAQAMFECLSMFDRFADGDYAHIEPQDPFNRYKTRIPGRINLNTAPVAVLKAVPGIGRIDGLAEAIVAYRDRTGIFADASMYPGTGIRTQAELFEPLSAVANLDNSSLDARDAVWSAILIHTTVRSDSFVVYGLVEALSALPDHDNSDAQWYDADNGHQKVVARRRFLALVDRSFQNYAPGENGGGVPRVLAMKDLPQ